MIDTTFAVPTDGASLSIYDPAVVADYAGDDLDRFDPAQIVGVRTGLFFAFTTGRDGVFRVRITDAELTVAEQEFAVARLPGLGLSCRTGRLRLSGYGLDAETADLPTTALEAGEYRVTVYEILWSVSQNHFSETGEPLPERPADYVLRLEPASASGGPFQLPDVALHLETSYLPGIDSEPDWLFPHPHRSVGTPPGTVLISTVILSRRSPASLCLKECGVEGLPVDLDDYTGLKWKDRVRFEVLELDRSSARFRGRFINRLP